VVAPAAGAAGGAKFTLILALQYITPRQLVNIT